MKKCFSTLALVAALIQCATSFAQDQPVPPDPFSQPEAAIQARIGVHRLMGANLMDAAKKLQAMHAAYYPPEDTPQEEKNKARDGVLYLGYEALNRASALEQLTQMYRDFFLVPGSYEGSNAKASIADNLFDFKEKERALMTAAFGMRSAVNNRDPQSGMKAAMSVMKACNDCHQEYMKQPLWIGPEQAPVGQH
jgi:hypothetical protein